MLAVALTGCSFSPVNHRIKIGEEAFVVFVGEGADHHVDLFAAPASGGEVAQVTFTPLVERDPRLSPTGEVVAFLRGRDSLPATHRDVVLMNLIGGGEQIVALPDSAGEPATVAWSRNGETLYVRTDRGDWQAAMPAGESRATPVPADKWARADSAFGVWLGEPRFARAVPCIDSGVCVISARGDTSALAPLGHDAVRWGDDSVAWFEGSGMVVRSLGPGRERRVTWTQVPGHARDGSYAPARTPPAP